MAQRSVHMRSILLIDFSHHKLRWKPLHQIILNEVLGPTKCMDFIQPVWDPFFLMIMTAQN